MQLMLLFDKKEPEKQTIGQCRATNGFKNFFHIFKQTLLPSHGKSPISTFESFEKIDFLRLQFLNKVPDRRFS